MKKILGVMLFIPVLLWAGLRFYNSIVYEIDCEGHIKRAADANTVEIAEQEMKTVIAYLETRGMTSGYTSVLYRTPDADVGFWYQNLKASLDELERITPQTTQLERSNVLIKLRETLLEHGQSLSVTQPEGISIYPNNVAYAQFGWLGLVAAIAGFILFIIGLDD